MYETASSKHMPSGHLYGVPPEHLMQEPWHPVVPQRDRDMGIQLQRATP